MASRTVSARVMVEGEEKYKQSMAALADSNNNFGNSAGKLGDQVKDLSGKLGVHMPEGATKALNGMNGFSTGTVAAMGAAAGAVMAAYKAIKELSDLTLKAAADVDELITKSMVTGVSTEMLQKWEYASNLIDVSTETMTGSLTRLTRNMASARDGNSETAQSFAALGISIEDSNGNLRDAESVFFEVIDALGQIENPTERDAAAMELLGRSAQELNPLIIQGTDALREYMAEAEEVGYVLGEEDVAALGALDDAVQRNELMWDSLKKQLAAQFAPAATEALEAFTKLTKTAGEALVNSHLIENLGSIITALSGVIDLGADLVGALPGWMNPLKQVSNAFKGLAVVIATVVDAMKVLIGLTPAFWGSGMLKEGLGLGASSGNYSNLQQVLGYDRSNVSGWVQASDGTWVANGWNASGNDNWRGGMTWVGEAGPELVSLPRGSQILSAQESAAVGGAQYITINVQGIEQLDEVVRWYEGRRVNARMR